MLKVSLVVTAIILANAAIARADNVEIVQEGKKFSEEQVTVKVGENITFTNKDQVTHNVFSITPGMAFDLRTQKPGDSSSVKFDKPGEIDVQCAIHPQMKMKVKVVQ